MTWFFNPAEESVDVFDHEGNLVAENREFSGGWAGDFPDEILDIMRKQKEQQPGGSGGNGSGPPDDPGGGQGRGPPPTRYNQELLVDAATENIEQGTPP